MLEGPLGRVWRHKPDVAQVQSPDRFAILDLEHLDRPPMVLAGSAAVIWELLDGDRDEAAVCTAVAEHFGIPEPEATEAVTAFLDQLREQTLIVPVGES